mmetsp:Transcript_72397/g.169635  ORF Transcript_72397/g.169635 Transcript_72397/m.169635 type:complete len:203 (-) Transcript_72397:13-621(-)
MRRSFSFEASALSRYILADCSARAAAAPSISAARLACSRRSGSTSVFLAAFSADCARASWICSSDSAEAAFSSFCISASCADFSSSGVTALPATAASAVAASAFSAAILASARASASSFLASTSCCRASSTIFFIFWLLWPSESEAPPQSVAQLIISVGAATSAASAKVGSVTKIRAMMRNIVLHVLSTIARARPWLKRCQR